MKETKIRDDSVTIHKRQRALFRTFKWQTSQHLENQNARVVSSGQNGGRISESQRLKKTLSCSHQPSKTLSHTQAIFTIIIIR